jgi:hypothetical protein
VDGEVKWRKSVRPRARDRVYVQHEDRSRRKEVGTGQREQDRQHDDLDEKSKGNLLEPYLGLDVVDGVRRLDLEGDRLPSEGLDKDLHDGWRRTRGSEASKIESSVSLRGGRKLTRPPCPPPSSS